MNPQASASASLATPGAVVAQTAALPAMAITSAHLDGGTPPRVDAPSAPPAANVPAPATADAPASTMPTNVERDTAQTVAPAQPQTQFTVPGRPTAQATTAQLGTPAATPSAAPGAGSIGGAVLALVLVVGLILLLGWLAKRMPGIGGASNPALKVVGSLSLSPRERVVVIAVGDTQLVLGTGTGGTRVLHQLDVPLPVPPSKAPPAFAQVLAQHFGKKS